METKLINIEIVSIYKKDDKVVNLPERMAKCTPDMHYAIQSIAKELEVQGGALILSDLFRSYDMQLQAHNDYVAGKKKAYSPPPGGSFHESGRAFDLSLSDIKIPLSEFWEIAAKYGINPIIDKPNSRAKEAWHFDCRGSHQIVYDYYKSKKGTNYKPYTASAISAILAVRIKVDFYKTRNKQAYIQSALIRLGKNIGNIDGLIGNKTKCALKELDIDFTCNSIDYIIDSIDNLLIEKFPNEFML